MHGYELRQERGQQEGRGAERSRLSGGGGTRRDEAADVTCEEGARGLEGDGRVGRRPGGLGRRSW